VSQSGYQLFVRSNATDEVEDAIRAYVAENGGSHSGDPDRDGDSTNLAGRTRRVFALSPPVEGTVAVWEDGIWADRRMAKDLSKRLATETIWLMLNNVNGSWAYVRHHNGEETGREHLEPEDVLGMAEQFAGSEGLPFAFEYLPDPNLDARTAALVEQLKAAGLWELKMSPEELAQEHATAEVEIELVDVDEREAEDQDDEQDWDEEPLHDRPALDSIRDKLREFSIDI
jgi:hypothetical protein